MNGERKIPVTKAMLMTVNIMVGAGILNGPAKMAAVAGSMSYWGWIIAALIYLPVVLSVARMAEVFPNESGFFAYAKQGLGNFFGFLAGWAYFVGYACSTASILSGYRDFLIVKFPGMVVFQHIYLFFLAAILILLVLNNMKVSFIAAMQSYLTAVKLIPVLSAVLLLPFFFKSSSVAVDFSATGKVLGTLSIAIFGYTGFEFAASMVDIIDGGAKEAKKAILGGFFLVTGLYIAFHLSLLNIMGANNLVTKLAPNFPLFVVSSFPTIGSILLILVPIATILTYFNSSNGLLFLDSKVLADLAEGENMHMANSLSKKNMYDRPFIAVLTVAMLVFTLGTVVASTSILMSITNFGIGISLLLANLSLFVVDKNGSSVDKAINILAIIALSCMMVYYVITAGVNLTDSLKNMSLFFAAILAGIVLYRNPSK